MIVLLVPQSCIGSLDKRRRMKRIIQSGKVHPRNNKFLFFKALIIFGAIFIFSLKNPVYSSMSSSLKAGSTVLSKEPKTLNTKGSFNFSRSPQSENGSLIEKLIEVAERLLTRLIWCSSTLS